MYPLNGLEYGRRENISGWRRYLNTSSLHILLLLLRLYLNDQILRETTLERSETVP